MDGPQDEVGNERGLSQPRPVVGWWCRGRVWVLPLALMIALALPQLFEGRVIADSGLYWGLSIHALEEGDFWTPMAGEERYFRKPPLPFWIHGLSAKLLGHSLFAMRLPNLLAGAGIVLVTLGLGRSLASRRVGMLSAIILVSNIAFFRFFKRFVLDYWHVLFMLLAVWLVVRAVQHRRGGWLILAGASVGAAIMCKPIGALLSLPILAGWVLWMKQPRLLWWMIGAIAAAAAVALPWHLSMATIHGDVFLNEYFGRQIIDRGQGAGEFDTLPWYYYGRHLARNYWPWLITLVAGVWIWCIRPSSRVRDWRLFTLVVVWCGAWLLLASVFADKRERYIMQVLPLLAMVSSVWIVRYAPLWLRRGYRRLPDVIIAFALVGSMALTISPVSVLEPEYDAWHEVYDYIRAHPEEHYRLGTVAYADGGRVYMYTGIWPSHCVSTAGEPIPALPGDLVLHYVHYRGHTHVVEPEDEVVLENGRVRIVRVNGLRTPRYNTNELPSAPTRQ